MPIVSHDAGVRLGSWSPYFAAEVMDRGVVVLRVGVALPDVRRQMVAEDVQVAVLVDRGTVCGVVTGSGSGTRVETDVVVVAPDTDLDTVARALERVDGRVAVVAVEGEVIGVVHRSALAGGTDTVL